MSATIVFSLDFELRWGVQDKLGDDLGAYSRNLYGVRDAVPAMLELFTHRRVRATWATVGAIACEGWEDWQASAPAWPRYLDAALGWREAYRRADPRLYFAPDLVDLVEGTEGQELGSHTFLHAYMAEPGFVRRDAEADAESMTSLFRRKWGTRPTTFVFPRNQVGFVDVLQRHGVEVWRDNPLPFYWSLTTGGQRTGLIRALRLADALLPMGTRSFDRHAPVHRASHFVRFALPPLAWRAHLIRLARDARRMRDEHVLHLWWHPHNLGDDVRRGISRLRDLLDVLEESVPQGLRFAAMGDIARRHPGAAPALA
jgi:peptidoglycan/xylan/chitin deacetylase (PgdA/CDA1 family)